MTKSRDILKRVIWTEEQINILKARYPNERAADIASSLGMKLHVIYAKANSLRLKKSEAFYASDVSGHGNLTKGAGTRFTKGQQSWNKGKKGLQFEGSKATQFKTNSVPVNVLPVGFIRTNTDGYLEIKTAPGMRKWVPLHRWNWKKEHGDFPAKNMALVFKDGNRLNCDISNLELISRTELMSRNTVHNLPKELAELVQLRGALNRKINRRIKNEQY
ncbi:HNH endonuclease signature motif containing protein [Undibacterium sp. SXout11W]|uniref:HNH endonuclease signature motif containing protein n=1 Tax=Undibacterium sp. SXout11W TaxID=3413050 RepID=UPI003BF43B2A